MDPTFPSNVPKELLSYCSVCKKQDWVINFSNDQMSKPHDMRTCKACVSHAQQLQQENLRSRETETDQKSSSMQQDDTRTLRCSACEQHLPRSDYSKAQIKLGPQMRCKKCISVPSKEEQINAGLSQQDDPTATNSVIQVKDDQSASKPIKKEPTLTCSQCKVSQLIPSFSNAQLKKGTDAKCKTCVAQNELITMKDKTSIINDTVSKPLAPSQPVGSVSFQNSVVHNPIPGAAPTQPNVISVPPVQIIYQLPPLPQPIYMQTQPGQLPVSTAVQSQDTLLTIEREIEQLHKVIQGMNNDRKSSADRLSHRLDKLRDELDGTRNIVKASHNLERRHFQLALWCDLSHLFKTYAVKELNLAESWPLFEAEWLNLLADIDDDTMTEDEVNSYELKLQQAKERFGFDVVEFLRIDNSAMLFPNNIISHPSKRLISIKNQSTCIKKCEETSFDGDLQTLVDGMLKLLKNVQLRSITLDALPRCD